MSANQQIRSTEQKEEIRQRFLQVDTSNVADVLDTMGYFNQGLAAAFAPYPADVASWPAGLIRFTAT